MPNLINQMIVREINSAIDGYEDMLIVSLSGLTVAETEGLRCALADHGVRLRMVRNRLTRLALKEHDIEPPADMLVGNIACVWGDAEQAIAAAKVLHKSPERRAGKVALKGGLFEGSLLGAQEAQALAELPGRDELRGMLVGVINAPVQQLVALLHAPSSSIARVLQARVDAQGGVAADE